MATNSSGAWARQFAQLRKDDDGAEPPLLDELQLPALADDDDGDDPGIELEDDARLHVLCEAWARWFRSGDFYRPMPVLTELVAGIPGKRRPILETAETRLIADADIAALHLAVIAQPSDSLDRRAFEMYYVARVANSTRAAAALGVSRANWYRLLREFRRRIYRGSREVLRNNAALAHVIDRIYAANLKKGNPE